VTPAADTNGVGCHDPLSDACTLSPQVDDYLGHLCGIFYAEGGQLGGAPCRTDDEHGLLAEIVACLGESLIMPHTCPR
jgi:hypothetical protein